MKRFILLLIALTAFSCTEEALLGGNDCNEIVFDKDYYIEQNRNGSVLTHVHHYVINGQEVTQAQYDAAQYGDCFYN